MVDFGNNFFTDSKSKIIGDDKFQKNAIPYSAFKGFVSLFNMRLPDALQAIGANAFDSCISLTEIVLPHTCEEINEFCFKNCKSLKSIIAESKNIFYDNKYSNKNKPFD